LKKTAIILGSARKDSHTRTLLRNVFSDIPHDLIDLLDHEISPFDYVGDYPDKDEFSAVIDRILQVEHIVFATPVYWYAMSGIMKNFLDRFTDLTAKRQEQGRSFKGKNLFLFSVGADPEPPAGFEVPFRETAGYFGMNYHEGVYLSSRGDNFEGVAMAKNLFSKHLH
jgi:multimeric flavodoxin WrbA